MEKIQSALKILYILSLCDRDVSQSEINIIQDFLQSQSPNLSFNPNQVINQMRFKTPMDQLQQFYLAALNFEKLTQINERLDLLRCAINLIYADHQLKPEEQALIEALAHWWNIDLPTFFATELSQVA